MVKTKGFGPFGVQVPYLRHSETIMSLAQISMHYVRRHITYATALKYMTLIGLMEAEARQLLTTLEACE